MANPEILVEIGATIEGLKKVLLDAEGKLKDFGTKAQKIGTALTVGLTTPLLLIGRASLRAASDAEETASKFETVFSAISGKAEESFKSLRNEYGLSSTASKQLLGDTGDLLSGFGFSQDAALDLATQVAKLGVDLASFTNFSGGAKGASEALTKALLGERESVKALGISILDEDVKKQVAINTAKGLTFETERQAKAYATLDIALAQSKNSIGDFSRTSDQFANQQRIASERIKEVSESLGKVFLPLATKVAGIVIEAANSFNELSDSTKETIVILGSIAASIGPVLLVFGTAIKLLPLFIAGFAGLGKAMVLATGPIGLLVIAAAGLTAAIIAINNGWKPFEILIKKTQAPIIDFSKATEKAKEAQLLLNTAVGVSIKENPNLIKSIKDQTFAKIEATKVILTQINAQRLSNIAIQEEIGLKDKLLFILNGGLTPEQRANERQTERNTKINKEFSEQSQALWKELNILSLSIFKLGVVSKDAEGGVGILKQTLEDFSKLADIRGAAIDLEIFSVKIAEEDAAFRNKLGQEVENKLSSLRDIIQKSFSAEVIEVDIKLDAAPVIEFADIDESSKTAFLESLKGFNEEASKILEVGIENTIGDFAFSIGEALGSGASVIKAGGGALLKGIATIANQLGQAAIAIGFGMKAIQESFKNPFTAIAAGVALIALSGFISSQVPKIPKSAGSGGMSSVGGGGMGAGSSFTGSGGMAFAGSRDINLMGSFRIDGNDLLYVIDRTKEGRI
jgi:hypothetical protein